ncbi:MAG TPA: BatA domain-containing protein [Gillisia sp.]|nr:BatA domain-containing protein [Gillisia sp.]
MQFNHPEVLYALFLLIIPIIVHLFQLRKFKKENFTNVKFLKRLTRQTRKSSRLKKWLVLATRLLLLTCIILAFSRPYFPGESEDLGDVETFIYLDNSYSMQAPGPRGRLLERSVQELLESIPEDRNISLLTNDEEFPVVSGNDIQNIEYSPRKLSIDNIILRAQNRFSPNPEANRKLLIISDFQGNMALPQDGVPDDITLYTYKAQPQNTNNISIDSVYYNTGLSSSSIKVLLSYQGTNPGNIPVSLYSEDKLIGKNNADFNNSESPEIEFPLENNKQLQGRIEIADNGLQFDNVKYFSINSARPIKIAVVNLAQDDFLRRIFNTEEFELSSMPLDKINYSDITEADVMILNEVNDLSPSLTTTLEEMAARNIIFIIIPPAEGLNNNYQGFLNRIGFPGLGGIRTEEKLVSQISFQHPVFAEVFEEEISNFEYPRVQSYYNPGSRRGALLSFEDGNPFLMENNRNFLFTAALNSQNSNFKQSPLIVPSFFNMAASALRTPRLYYLLGEASRIEVPVQLQGDRILEITSPSGTFIPQQQSFSRKIEIVTEDFPSQPGNFTVMNGEEKIMGISYNVHREESSMNYITIPTASNIMEVDSLNQFFSSPGFTAEIDSLWKWFVTFALLFLLIETLLLKYLK